LTVWIVREGEAFARFVTAHPGRSTMKFKLFECVVLDVRRFRKLGLVKGDHGAVVELYEPDGLEVEIFEDDGRPATSTR